MPFGLGLDALGEMLGRSEVPDDFEVVLSVGRPVDALGDPAGTEERIRTVRAAGATLVSTAVHAESADHYCEQLEALAIIGTVISKEIG